MLHQLDRAQQLPLDTSASEDASQRPDLPDDPGLRDWLFALLRFAVTRDPHDRMSLVMAADRLDRRGCKSGARGFTYFGRTTTRFCDALADGGDPRSAETLQRMIKMIDSQRLRRALQAAIDPGSTPRAVMPKTRGQKELWSGLQRR
jgi:hypothetical protein